MKLKSCHTGLLTALTFVLVFPLSALAQEDRMSFDTEIPTKDVTKQDQETPSGVDNAETRSGKNPSTSTSQEAPTIRDSELKSAKPVVKAVEKSPKEEEKLQKKEDDPLSFNFLYYIIEKFKLSDIVE